MKLASLSFADGAPIPEHYAFGKMDVKSRVELADNFNPQFTWSDVPEGVKSFALLCVDPDVPTVPDDVNVADRLVPADLPRTDFFHWVLVDLPARFRTLEEGHFSNGISARGKSGPQTHIAGVRQGINDYTGWFAADPDMSGDYYGYDGPCPPWNDARVHRYVFTLYALDVETLALPERFDGKDVQQAMDGHVLDSASWTGTFTLNPALAPVRIGPPAS
ncbi:YbhB/YbcL family Raf kinase inhibitor-like protein [Kerstersia gyiorum]|jgi:Raf kinase inhibitor-like YbhB/YbcL family protein|uniref:Phospholipid-binding protein n=1 Tax=Kerstersia gyiorum TaxID=206506 RepID=A0A171KQD7_9BURK|nr:YbhB/YbcL family Raf kinase inhibitor-like protein [Kerstersia gyiorum]AZV92447.1 phospholipid-binding protein [Bordetella sp. J329]MCO7641891.1 YbhB/YbcL family Raf kinase inhibitor-like protein [Pseudomonas sp. S 311-6]KAB0543902.1 YbhB/YbcL family Raf kinase inhibitor-like protein [Kerstersia gyiorum]KKO71104.1 phospholipid-binding protein [Kerstersia gyiorum]MCH4270193.1 YbhB/YbcL family Raf kinase inhibitor-like protein [Kerstersia gyiorum]